MVPTQSRPTIHWISPLPPAETDIAHYTARILPALSSHAEVILWTDADTWDLELERYCTVKSFNPDTVLPRDFTAASSGDGLEVLFLNIGNSWVFHAGILRMAQRIPSVVVLHDLAIQELMIEAVKGGEWRASVYLAGMEKWYGPSGMAVGRACINRSEQGSVISRKMPGFELALERAFGVLTHTKVAQESVQHRLPHLPCQMLPLPFEVGPKPSEMRTSTGPLRLLQFGWIGPNRRLEQVLDALAEMPADFDYRFDVMGKLWKPDLIYNKIDQLNLSDRVHLHGFVPEPVLEDTLRQAHLVLNLRHPSMGEASGSQLRIWNAGTPAAVTREGWYAELPEDTVYFIAQESEISQLQSLFHKINKDRKAGGKVGAAGRAYFEAHHAPESYAQKIIQFCEEVALDANRELAMRLRVDQLHSAQMHPSLEKRLQTL
ncbi:glycosyltransferase [Sulfitobacter sp. 915]|uniref:glycosyltransferase n=1 Tax=Sulfitobacter sp. 915 TaxID=3368558 RepID=UPI0037461DC1